MLLCGVRVLSVPTASPTPTPLSWINCKRFQPCVTQRARDPANDVQAALEGKLESIEGKDPLGKAEVKEVFGSGAKNVHAHAPPTSRNNKLLPF